VAKRKIVMEDAAQNSQIDQANPTLPAPERGLSIEELSALVAVKFLGHKWLRDRDDKYHEGGAFLCSPKNFKQFEPRYVEADEQDRHGNDMYWAQQPAADIAAAMEVVDCLYQRGYMVSVHANGIDKAYWCAISSPPECLWVESGMLPTAAEAICRAALALIEATHQSAKAGEQQRAGSG